MIIIIKDLFRWFNANKLTVNFSKTCYTIFKSRNKKIPAILDNIKIDDVLIRRVPSATYLGVILDENLNWEEHINSINKTMVKISNSLKIIKNHVAPDNKMLLYHAYIYSKIQYGIEAYGRASATALKKIQIQQNKALKILFQNDYYTTTKQLHKELEVLLVNDINKLYILKFVYKQQNGLLPELFHDYFQKNNAIHQHNTRKQHKLHVEQPKDKFGKTRIKYQGEILWNDTADKICNSKTIKNFSHKLKNNILKQYDD